MKKLYFLFFVSQILAQSDDSWKIYDDSRVARVDITINSAALNWMYNNVQSDSEHYAKIRFRNNWFDETVDSIGFRLRGNTSRVSKKKSFKVSFNSFIKGRKFHGVEKLNLNGEHNDPSIIRSKLAFDLYQDAGVVASRANHAQVYINGKYYGLYISVEHVDEEFISKNFLDDSGNLWKCLYPADLKYLGADPNLYKKVMHNSLERAYELTTNESKDDYTMFAKLVDVINNTPSATFKDSVEKYLDVRRVLQYVAMNSLVGGWDDYRSLMNNFYFYHIPSENKFSLIPYDYDNTFGVDWFNVDWAKADPYTYPKVAQGARPLTENILKQNSYRNLFTHFLQFYSKNVFQLSLWENRINRLRDSISSFIAIDSFRTLDYGFTLNDFHNSYSAVNYNNLHVKYGLKQFVNSRLASLSTQLNYLNGEPIAYFIEHSPKQPQPNDTIWINASCFSEVAVQDVLIHFTPTGSSNAEIFSMKFSPIENSKHVEDADRWRGFIPPLKNIRSGSYKIFVKDSLQRIVRFPRVGEIEITVKSTNSSNLVINEFMADNGSIPDSSGQFDDWIELYNPTDSKILLTDKFLTDKKGLYTKWKFSQQNLFVEPKNYLVVWCDEDSSQLGIHAMFKLSAGGEFIAITDSDGVTILDSLSFGAQKKNISFGRFPDGSTSWGFMNPTPWKSNSIILSVNQKNEIKKDFRLSQNYPNPFNPKTVIKFQILNKGDVILKIFDLLGNEVETLINDYRLPGEYQTVWNGTEKPSGVYFYQLKTGDFIETKRLMLLK